MRNENEVERVVEIGARAIIGAVPALPMDAAQRLARGAVAVQLARGIFDARFADRPRLVDLMDARRFVSCRAENRRRRW